MRLSSYLRLISRGWLKLTHRKAVLLDPRFGPAWVAFAHAYALEGEHDQSITAYSTAQRHFQGTHLPLLFIGMQHLQLNNFAVSREHLDAAWAMCTVDPLLANEVGVACYWSDEYVVSCSESMKLNIWADSKMRSSISK